MKSPSTLLPVLATTLLLGAALSSQAQDAWQWNATIYGWFPSIGGSTAFPSGGGGGGSGVDVSAQQILDSLKFTFMGTLEGSNGRWGFLTDVVYVDLGASKAGTRDVTIGGVQLPAGVDANLYLDIKGWVWTLAGTYALASTPKSSSNLVFGTRLLDMRQTLGWQFNGNIGGLPLPGSSGNSEAKLSNWDAIVGVKGRISLGDSGHWYVPYYADIGTGESKFTWQALAGLGYRFNWGSVVAAWRYLDYEFKSGNALQSMNFNGAAVGVNFHW
jgi:hypothetical protein